MLNDTPEALFKQVAEHLQVAQYLLRHHIHANAPSSTEAYLVRSALGRLRDAQETARVALGVPEERVATLLAGHALGAAKPAPQALDGPRM